MVRQQADGRTLVYACRDSALPGERTRRGGYLLMPGADIAEAIYELTQELRLPQSMAEPVIDGLRGSLVCARAN